MNKVLLILNTVLLILVGYLYFLHFSGSKAKSDKLQKVALNSGNDSANTDRLMNIGYLELDSLETHFGYYQKIKTELTKKQNAAANEITSLQKRFQDRTSQLQQTAITPQDQEKAMAEINKMQQDFQNRQQALDKSLFDYNEQMKDDILGKIESFLKDYNKDGKFSYIFSYEPGFMFYKDSTFNITKDVIEGLNASYPEKDN